MKYLLTLCISSAILLGIAFTDHNPSNKALVESKNTSMEKSKKHLRHVVLFKFKATSSEQDISKVREAFSELPNKIPQIKDYEWGLNNSPEGLNKGFTHCFFVTFKSEEDRAIYLPHSAHKAFVDILKPHLEDVLVVDYWANDK